MTKKQAKSSAKAVANALKDAATLAAKEAEEDEDTDDEQLDDDVVRALTELEGASDIRWAIHRQSQPNPGYCGECSTAELSLLYIAENYGEGRYQIKGTRTDGAYFKSRRVTIAKPAKKPDVSADLLATLKSPNAQDNTLLLALMNQNTQVLTAALARPEKPEKEFPWKEIIVASPLLLTGIKEFFTRKDAEAESMEKILKLVTVVEKLKGSNDDKGSTWTDIVRDALSSVPAMVAAAKSPGAAQPVPATAVPGTPRVMLPAHDGATGGASASVDSAARGDSAARSAETPEAVAATPEALGVQWLQGQLTVLVQKAAQNRNAVLYAELFFDELPAYIPETLIEQLLSGDDWFERLCQFDPRVAPYRGWFEKFVETLLNAIGDADDDDDRRGTDGGTGSASTSDTGAV